MEWVAISSYGSSQPRDWTWVSCVSCITGGLFTTEPPGKPLVYTLFVYTLIQKTLVERVEFYWLSYLCNHGPKLCVSLLLSSHFLWWKSQCSGFSAWRLTRTDCDTLSGDTALPSLCSPGGWGIAPWRPSVHVSGVVGALCYLIYSPWLVPRQQVTGLYKLACCPLSVAGWQEWRLWSQGNLSFAWNSKMSGFEDFAKFPPQALWNSGFSYMKRQQS